MNVKKKDGESDTEPKKSPIDWAKVIEEYNLEVAMEMGPNRRPILNEDAQELLQQLVEKQLRGEE